MGNTVRIRNGMSNATEGDILGNASDLIKDLGVVNLAGGHLLVSEDSPKGMTVQVAGGIVYVPNSNYDELDSDTPKFYPVVCSSEVLIVDNNVSGSTRFDIVCVKVDKTIMPDPDADNIATKVVVKGTPGAGVPATPANHYKLAEIEVANGETEITNALITDTREQVLLDGTFVESLSLVWKGAWATSTPYSLNDTVEHNGSGYVCTQANTSGATTEPGVGASWTDYWDLFVEGFDPAKAETLTNKTIDGDDNTISLADTGWIDLGYGTGYEDETAFGFNPQYRKVGGIVYLRGIAKRSTGNVANADKPIGTLPEGCRPSAVRYFPCRTSSGYLVTLQINADGTSSISVGGYTSGTYVSIDSIVFHAD